MMSRLMDELSILREQGYLQDIDLELCRFLGEQDETITDEVLLAASLVSHLYRQGDVCLSLEEYASQPLFGDSSDIPKIKTPDLQTWIKALSQSGQVGSPGDFKPLILDEGGRLYLHKLWHYEDALTRQLIKRSQQQAHAGNMELLRDGLGRLFPQSSEGEVDWQKVAAATAVRNNLSIISGGPGTGKTSTVVRILALLLEQAADQDTKPSIALAAPTGKAAARLKDSITSSKQDLPVSEQVRAAIPEETMTLHQLLGARRHTSSFKYDAENPVPYDVVVVDEASMVDQALMSKLVNALLVDTRLILLGDKDQLASVEAGSVLGDICNMDRNRFSGETIEQLRKLKLEIPDSCIAGQVNPLTDHITLLTRSYRFGSHSGIGQLAQSVNSGNAEQALQVLQSDEFEDVELISVSNQAGLEDILKQKVTGYFREILQSRSAEQALQVFNRFRILAAHRTGPWGIEFLNRYVEKILQGEGLIPKYAQWYSGRPVIINVNDYTLGLHNGDTGICLQDKDGQLKVYFRHEDTVRDLAPGRLPDHSTAYCLTVHKSQGSEFEQVLFVLPQSPSKVLSRELMYTAITRARTGISILGNKSVLREGIKKKLQRSSGLKNRLWPD